MALTQRSIGKSRQRLILLVLTAITLLSLDLSSFGPLGTAQRLLRDLLHPITEVAGAIVSPFSDAWNAVFDYDDLEAQNRLLTERIQQLEGNELAVEAERAEFERLRAATGVDVRPDLARVTATVVRGGVGNFDDDVITIDRGSQDGVRTGMAVVTNAGLVGRVERVDATTSAVLLLTDLHGATPSNGASLWLSSQAPNASHAPCPDVAGVAGVSLPLLLKALTYKHLSPAALA
ncbi:MAG: hypothetical protein EBZ17_07235, partial [Actinobacteria bacterium]|nr:hypothetical protein [Actinomycetota bacterium]